MRYRLPDRRRVPHRMFVATRRGLRRGTLLLGIRRVRLLRLLLLPYTLGLVLGRTRSMYRGLVANVFGRRTRRTILSGQRRTRCAILSG